MNKCIILNLKTVETSETRALIILKYTEIFSFLYLLHKGLSLCNKVKYLNPNIFRTRCCKPLIFQTLIIWFNRIPSLKYLRSVTFGSKDIVTRKSEFVAKTQFLCKSQIKLLILDGKAIPSNYAQFLSIMHNSANI